MNRRDFMKWLAAVGASTALGAYPQSGHAVDKPQRPNFLVILTDQERHHLHWPQGFTKRHMPSWGRLQKNGLTFNRAYCAATQCSPSRACILTGHYSNLNQVPSLAFPGGLPNKTVLPNIGSWLADKAGYEVVWKGKWHLSYPIGFKGGPPDGEVWTEADIKAMEENYGLAQWNPPEAGNDVTNSLKARTTLGGGNANNDGRFVQGLNPDNPKQTKGMGQSAIEYIRQLGRTPKQKRKPFCLFVSLVNPHDIAYFPNGWDEGGYDLADFKDLGIGLPPNIKDDLSTKPGIQKKLLEYLEGEAPLASDAERLDYVNFYAHLHQVVNGPIDALLNAMDSAGLTRDTIIIRTADHGEMCLSHGLREKSYVAYEEAIHVPLTISNPELFPKTATTDAIYSHVDLAATMAHLAGVPGLGVGKSQVPVLLNPDASVRQDALFAYDDYFFLPKNSPASHIKALRDERYTYAVYYSADGSLFEYELYDNQNDPLQMNNLAFNPSPSTLDLIKILHKRLTQRIRENMAQPKGFNWPTDPLKTKTA
ncbi:sulfatase-like hydrolase/transferase [Dethiosulfatarculus sandiegensis]|uniref:Sulfatase N-terminal domain-containing protein n=1 Tax=Dethiosulfatarculus sandiegensis TaxID=1429043 RepID=A0A0D2JNA1_9BACT|nr:sulfatase-like hydrolase/transferase [Dethiosulfatarculus sandiegensis]KIX10965.1 hypothetical protein X474_26545 [Dethiosulfatarculus sandiegensis]